MTSEEGQDEETKLSPQAPTDTEGNSDAHADVDLSAQIDENNADLADRIKNAINLTHSVAGIAPGVNPASVVQQLESLIPSGAGDTAQSWGVSAVPKLEPETPTSAAPISTAPAAASARQVSRQDLGLLSLFNFLTPSDMAIPLNDPSALLPTPFAPGQSASTLQQQRAKPLIAPTAATAIPVSSLPAAALQFPQYMLHPHMQTQITQQSLLQQLASAYSAGGQSVPPPAAAAGVGPMPSAFVGGLMQPMVAMNDFNFLMAGGYPASLNQGVAVIPGALNTGMMGVLPGFGSFGNMGNFMWNTSGMTPMAASYAMASMPHQIAALQEQFNSNAHGKMPNSTTSSHNGSASSNLGTDEPLIKSREARWLIRYNELLQVIIAIFVHRFNYAR